MLYHDTPTKRSIIHLVLGGGFVLLAVFGTLAVMGRATGILVLGLIIAYAIWVVRGSESDQPAPGLLPIYLAALVVMAGHVGEEFLAGFQHQFPALFGDDWSDAQYLVFNAVWLGVFVLAALGLYRRRPLAYLVAWFVALVAGVGNGVGHLLLSLSQGRYFPGTYTAPLCLIVGLLLMRRLMGTGGQRAPA